MLRGKGLWLALIAGLLLTQPAQAATIFFDDFNSEALGLNTALDEWTITNGTVDVIGPGFIDLCTPAGSPSRCVDLDGSTSNAVTMGHAFTLAPGDYSLSYALAGSQRGDTNTVNVSLGSLFAASHTLLSAVPFTSFGGFFTVLSTTSATLTFDHLGGDNLGLLLDDVRLDVREVTAVPEPATLVLLTTGIAVGALRRRIISRRNP